MHFSLNVADGRPRNAGGDAYCRHGAVLRESAADPDEAYAFLRSIAIDKLGMEPARYVPRCTTCEVERGIMAAF